MQTTNIVPLQVKKRVYLYQKILLTPKYIGQILTSLSLIKLGEYISGGT